MLEIKKDSVRAMTDNQQIQRIRLQDGVMKQTEPSRMRAIYNFIRTQTSNIQEYSLDVGCGDGSFLYTLKNGVGIEASKELAHICKLRKLRVVIADANFLPFKDEVFDLVTCIEVIEHTSTPYRMLNEIYRVTKKGGRLFISTPNLAGPVYILSQMIKRRPSPGHRVGFDPYLLSQALHLVNFKIVNLAGVIVARSSIYLPLSWVCTKIPNLATCIIAEGIKES